MVGSLWSLAKPRELICLPEHQSFPLPCSSSSHLLLSWPGRLCSTKVVKMKEPQNLQRFFKWWQKKKKNKKRVNGPRAVQRSGAELKPLA